MWRRVAVLRRRTQADAARLDDGQAAGKLIDDIALPKKLLYQPKNDSAIRVGWRLHDRDAVVLIRWIVQDIPKVLIRGEKAQLVSDGIGRNRTIWSRAHANVPNIGCRVAI